VIDDIPVNFTPDESFVHNLASADPQVSTTESLLFASKVGADEPGSVVFDIVDNSLAIDSNGNALKAEDGTEIRIFGDDSATLIGYADENGDGNFDAGIDTVVFQYDVVGDSYTFTLYDPLLNGTEIANIGFTGAKAGNLGLTAVGSNDPNNPIDFFLSSSDSVNTNDFSIGVGSGQRIDTTETLRIDFASNITDDGANPNPNFAYDSKVQLTDFRENIAIVNPSDPLTSFTVQALLQSPAADHDLQFFGDLNDTHVQPVEVKIYNASDVLVYDVLWNGTAGGSVQLDDGVDTAAVTFDLGSLKALISNVGEGYDYEIITANPGFDAVEIQAVNDSPFKLGIFSIETTKATDPITLIYNVLGTDFDGDSVPSQVETTVMPTSTIFGTNLDDTGGTALSGTANSDAIAGLDGNDTISGLAGADFLFGGSGNDNINGGDGGDLLVGGQGNDTLTGGNQADTFAFNLPSDGVDNIIDFAVGVDHIQFTNLGFTAIGAPGTLAAGEFVIGAAAADAGDRIIYNSATGALYYDSDGTGSAAAIQVAQMATGLALTNNDFKVVGT
jgi:Ca2+-binding RTX toxin-like protein